MNIANEKDRRIGRIALAMLIAIVTWILGFVILPNLITVHAIIYESTYAASIRLLLEITSFFFAGLIAAFIAGRAQIYIAFATSLVIAVLMILISFVGVDIQTWLTRHTHLYMIAITGICILTTTAGGVVATLIDRYRSNRKSKMHKIMSKD